LACEVEASAPTVPRPVASVRSLFQMPGAVLVVWKTEPFSANWSTNALVRPGGQADPGGRRLDPQARPADGAACGPRAVEDKAVGLNGVDDLVAERVDRPSPRSRCPASAAASALAVPTTVSAIAAWPRASPSRA